MTKQDTSQELVDAYLEALEDQIQLVRSTTRNEFISEIADHIAEGRARLNPEDLDGLRTLLEHLGSPDALAREVIENEQDVKRNLGWRQRVRSALAPVAVLLVVGLTVSSLTWWTHYQPLRQSPLFQTWPSITLANGKLIPQVNAASSDIPGEVPIWKMPSTSSTVHITVEIENAGSFPITITSVQSPFPGWPAFGPARVSLGNLQNGHARRFHTISVGANRSTEVRLSIPMHCMANSGSTVEPTRVLVGTSFFGVSHQVWVNIEPFNIEFPKVC